MSTGFFARVSGLFTHKERERRVLLNFAALRNTLVVLFVLAMVSVRTEQGWPGWLVLFLAPCDGCLAALVSADWVEHYGFKLAVGYAYNPNVKAIGELELAMTPITDDPAVLTEWRRTMFTRASLGDDPRSGHYPYPLPWPDRLWRLFEEE